jgi:hypothetical protein
MLGVSRGVARVVLLLMEYHRMTTCLAWVPIYRLKCIITIILILGPRVRKPLSHKGLLILRSLLQVMLCLIPNGFFKRESHNPNVRDSQI